VNRIEPGSFLTLHYRLAGPDGADVVNTFGGKPATLSLGTGQLAPALERHLIGLEEGAHARPSTCRPARPSASATPSCCSA
jgi:FKBP-type peptidyl-prolyl cis-trans isomerase SlpA